MTRKATRRRHWPLLPDAISHVIQGISPTPIDKLDKLRLIELSAIEAFAKGHATKHDWRALADLCNVAQTFSENGVGPEALEPCMRAQAALGAAHARQVSLNRLGLSGPELQAMRDVFDWHDAQRTAVTRGEYERAIQRTANRIRSAASDVKVYV